MIYTELTRKAMRIAFDAHFGQVDRGNTPYICHPLHVADGMNDERTTVIALLHDVLEDTDVTPEDLRRDGIPEDLIEAVKILTKPDPSVANYQQYIDSVIASGSREALIVKLADLEHNLDESRTADGHLPEYLKKRYRTAREKIVSALG